jgi:hypothetical protein
MTGKGGGGPPGSGSGPIIICMDLDPDPSINNQKISLKQLTKRAGSGSVIQFTALHTYSTSRFQVVVVACWIKLKIQSGAADE